MLVRQPGAIGGRDVSSRPLDEREPGSKMPVAAVSYADCATGGERVTG